MTCGSEDEDGCANATCQAMGMLTDSGRTIAGWKFAVLGASIALCYITVPVVAPTSMAFLLRVYWYTNLGTWTGKLLPPSWSYILPWLFHWWSPDRYPWSLWINYGTMRGDVSRTWEGWWLQVVCISWSVALAFKAGYHGPLLLSAAGCVSWLVYLRTWWSCLPDSYGSAPRILLLAVGSRGDVQPMVLLGKRLQASGYQVRLACSLNQIEFCASWGIDPVPAFFDLALLFRSLGGFSSHGAELLVLFMLQSCWSLVHPVSAVCRAFRPDMLVYDPSSRWLGPACEDLAGVPAVPVYYEASQVDRAVLTKLPRRPAILATSPQLEHMAPNAMYHTGAWVPRGALQPKELAALEPVASFLDSGPPPIAIGWGSMIAKGCPPEKMLLLALEATHLAGRRAVVLGGWAELDRLGHEFIRSNLSDEADEHQKTLLALLAEYARKNCHFASSVPHRWLLPRCSCFVHHGGSGATHAALEAGVPSVVTPIAFDQFRWASKVGSLRVGFGFSQPLQHITARRLAQAIGIAEMSDHVAQSWSQRLKSEDGVAKAASVLIDFMHQEVITGDWHRRFAQHHGLRRFCYN